MNIWKDRWLPIPDSFKVVSPRSHDSELEMVGNLLDLDWGSWDIEKVRCTFLHHEVKVILAIPISPNLREDSQSWAWTKNGKFSIMNAYGVALKILKETKRFGDGGGSLNSSKMTNLWKSIWNLNCPSKIKHFMWRVCKNIRPTNHCLKRRNVASSNGCVLCEGFETKGHILLHCKIATKVWKEIGIKMPNGSIPHVEFIDTIWKLMDMPTEIDWELFATTT